MATVPEPKRRGLLTHGKGGSAAVAPQQLPVREVMRFLFDNRRAYAPMFIGLAVQSVMVWGIIAWMPSFFIRTHGWSVSQFGQVIGLINLLILPLGLMVGGVLAERLARMGYDDINMRLVALVAALTAPLLALFPLMGNPWVAVGMLAVQSFIVGWGIGPQNAALQVITPNQMRGQVTALYLFVFNLIGFGLGPTFIAVLTDYVFGSEDQLRYAMALAAAVMAPLAALIYWSGLKAYGETVARASR